MVRYGPVVLHSVPLRCLARYPPDEQPIKRLYRRICRNSMRRMPHKGEGMSWLDLRVTVFYMILVGIALFWLAGVITHGAPVAPSL